MTVPIEQEVTKIYKKRTCILQFINSTRFMASSLSNLVNNLSEGIHSIKCKLGHDDEKCETCRVKYLLLFS